MELKRKREKRISRISESENFNYKTFHWWVDWAFQIKWKDVKQPFLIKIKNHFNIFLKGKKQFSSNFLNFFPCLIIYCQSCCRHYGTLISFQSEIPVGWFFLLPLSCFAHTNDFYSDFNLNSIVHEVRAIHYTDWDNWLKLKCLISTSISFMVLFN